MEYNTTFQRLSITSGTEGPKHDPYSYTVYTFENNFKKVELKVGLMETLKVNGERVLVLNSPYDEGENHEELFQRYTGLNLRQFHKAYERIHNPKNCPKCGSTKRDYYSGHPGEEFNVCHDCGEIIDVIFNIGAVI